MADRIEVMGGGIFGLAVAYACARRGAQVRLIERRQIAAGASGGLVGALAPHVPEGWNATKQFQLESLLMAESWWADVARLGGGDPGYGRLGRVQPLADAAAVERARARVAGARAHWGAAAQWQVRAAADVPGLPVISPTGLVIQETLSARINPRRGCAALAAALRALGAEVIEGASAPLPPRGPRATGRVTVWATGWEGLAGLRDPRGRIAGAGVKGQALLLGHDAGPVPQVYADGIYLVPHADGTLAVGSTSERDFVKADTTDIQLDDVLARAIALCPVLGAAPVVERWGGVRPRARSRVPLLGALPGRPGEYVANGGFRIGFGMAPKVAEVMADLILEGRTGGIPEAFLIAPPSAVP